MKTKTEVDLKKVVDYLETVSNHCYLTEKNKFFKAFPIQVDGKWYFVQLEFDGKESNHCTITEVDYYVKQYGSCAKAVIGDIIFPPHYDRRKSIVNFKAMKEKTEEIKKFIEENFDGTNKNEIQQAVKEQLVGLTIKKEEDATTTILESRKTA